MIFDLFKKKTKDPSRSLPAFQSDREAQFITIDKVKSALSSNDFEEIISLFDLFLSRDLKIAEGVEKRQNAITAASLQLDAGAKERKVIEGFLERVPLSEILLALGDGIYFGYSLVEWDWQAHEGMLLPDKLTHHAATMLHLDSEKEAHYLLSKKDRKLYTDSLYPRLTMYRHARSGDKIQNRAMAYKLLYYAVLKHATIGYNIQYFDSLSIPPLILKGENVTDDDVMTALTTALMSLKSNSYGVFPKSVELDSLKVGSQTDFLSLIEYFDGLIAQYITGATSISDGRAGSLALAKMQDERFREKVRFDAARISEGLSGIFNTALALNLSSFTPVRAVLDTKVEPSAEEFAEIVSKLSSSGYVVDKDQIERKTGAKILDIKRKESNARSPLDAYTPPPRRKESNSTQPAKPLSIQERIIEDEDLSLQEEEIEQLLSMIEESNSYEEVLSRIEEWDNPALEEALTRLIFGDELLGRIE